MNILDSITARRAYGGAVGHRKAARIADPEAGKAVIQNLSLAAHSLGLGTHIKTGAIMDDPAARSAVGLPDSERIVATINIGEPEALPDRPARQPATQFTAWVE